MEENYTRRIYKLAAPRVRKALQEGVDVREAPQLSDRSNGEDA